MRCGWMSTPLCGKAEMLPYMKAHMSGHIINVSAVAGHKVRMGGAEIASSPGPSNI